MGETDARPASVLEEEREFFLRSLRDLEAEHDAGDIDDADYRALKEDYTVRAAAVLRELQGGPEVGDDGGAGVEPVDARNAAAEVADDDPDDHDDPVRRRWPKWAIWGAAALLLGGLAGWAVVAASGHRSAGQTVSGDTLPAQKTGQLLADAEKQAAAGNAVKALKDCQTILATNPNQPEALAEEGWLLAQTQQANLVTEGLGDLTRAVALAPTDTTAHLYRGIVLLDRNQKAAAVTDLQYYLAHNPDPKVVPRVQSALAQAQQP